MATMKQKNKRKVVQDDTAPMKKAKTAVRKEAPVGKHEAALPSQKRYDLWIPVASVVFVAAAY